MMTEQGTLERLGDTYRSGNEASRSGNEASRSGNEASRSGNEASRSGNEAGRSGDEASRSGNEAIVKLINLIIIAQSMINTSSGTYPTHSRVTVVTLEHPDNDRIGRITRSILVHLCKVHIIMLRATTLYIGTYYIMYIASRLLIIHVLNVCSLQK